MKKLTIALPATLLAVGAAFLSTPGHADWHPDMAQEVPNQSTAYTDNATGSTSPGNSTSPFLAKGEYDITAPAGSYPGSTSYSADVNEGNQWKQTYTWVNNGIAPYAFDIGVTGTASGSCSASPSGFNDWAHIESSVSFSLNGGQNVIGAYGDATASGYGSNSADYGPSAEGTTYNFPSNVVDGQSPYFLLIRVHAAGYGTENFGESKGNCNTYGNVQIPTPHWMTRT